MSDLVERLRAPHSSVASQSFLMNEAATEITRLRAELAGRDAEIAGWLRAQADFNDRHVGEDYMECPADSYRWAATAIEAGSYREGEGHG